MNREIKFRNCSHIDKKCYEPMTIAIMFNEGKTGAKIAKDNELCQYTGLKDINGKEIYEGDIVKYWGPGLEVEISTVEYRECRFCPIYVKGIHPEVIGNIYENPKLLTQ